MASMAAKWLCLWGLIGSGMAYPSPPSPADPDFDEAGKQIAAQADAANRMTVAVHIDGRGPFAFVVDTGAERTVISTELAAQLRLAPLAAAQLLSLSEVSTVPIVLIPNLAVSDAVIERIDAPVLARAHLGAAGILGIDTLQEQRVIFDFKRGMMTVSPASAREERRSGDEIVVTARSRFGRLILADASVEGQKVHVIIDSGAQLSVGNSVLLRKLLARRKSHDDEAIALRSVTGGVIMANAATLRSVRIGGIELQKMPVAIADSQVFRRLGLDKKPALLLGMDALRSFDRVSIDFANRKVRFRMPGNALRESPIRTAETTSPLPPG